MVEDEILNKLQLLAEISRRKKWYLSKMTFWYWDKKFDFVKPFKRVGSRMYILKSQVGEIIKRMEKLHEEGKIRITAKV